MYTDIGTILKDAVANHYAVIACLPVNLEVCRGAIAAANEKKAPLIFISGQNSSLQHANGELLVQTIKTMAEKTPSPIAMMLDHGSKYERLTYAFRHGYSSIMFDGSMLPMEENIRRTKEVVKLCHMHGMGVEGELGHVGQAANNDDQRADLYTKPEDAAYFVQNTKVDSLAVAVGTAHGDYEKGYVPHINFERIREIRKAVGNTPLALHGGSGSGDENIIKSVEAGMNKINVATDVGNCCRNYLRETLAKEPNINYVKLMMGMENAVKEFIKHWIDLTKSEGTAAHFMTPDTLYTVLERSIVDDGE